MTIAQQVFLYAAEEKSITKAAQRAFISQQCASTHIKNLEQQYGTLLFTRKPTFALTPAGEYLRSSLYRLNIIEREMEAGMLEIGSGMFGNLSIGINATRARILIPEILNQCKNILPGIHLHIFFGDRDFLIRQLEQGVLDMVISVGPHAPSGEQFRLTPLASDLIHFVTTEPQLTQFAPMLVHKQTLPTELPLSVIQNFPVCRNLPDSTVTKLIDELALRKNVILNNCCYVSDYDVQFSLCADGLMSMFCPSLVLERVIEYNKHVNLNQKMVSFILSDAKETLRMDLLQSRTPYEPPYVKQFIDILKTTIDRFYSNLEQTFPIK